MNSIRKKLEHRLTKTELQLFFSLTQQEKQYLVNTFSKDITNYLDYATGNSDIEAYNKPFVIFGSKVQLLKTKAFFIYKMINQCRFQQYTVSQISEFRDSKADLDDLPFPDCTGVAILYINKNENIHGNMEFWSSSCILEKLTERSRRGGLAIVLTESDFIGPLEDKSEFNYYNIYSSVIDGKNSAVFLTDKNSHVEDSANL